MLGFMLIHFSKGGRVCGVLWLDIKICCQNAGYSHTAAMLQIEMWQFAYKSFSLNELLDNDISHPEYQQNGIFLYQTYGTWHPS